MKKETRTLSVIAEQYLDIISGGHCDLILPPPPPLYIDIWNSRPASTPPRDIIFTPSPPAPADLRIG